MRSYIYPYSWGMTTSMRGSWEHIEAAKKIAKENGVPYLPRNRASLQDLQKENHLDYIVTLDRNMRLFVEEPYLRWHPALALTRLKRLAEGGTDLFLSAVSLEEGDRILDCTLGLGTDAILAAWAVGESGEVLGLEASPIIALLTDWGLKNEAPAFDSRKKPIAAIVNRIHALAEEAVTFLERQPDCSWDVVYFDPMFRAANMRSSGMNSIRPVADHTPFNRKALDEAFRVCGKRVVLKERWFSPLFQQMDADRTVKTKYSPVAYGIWEKR